MTSEDQAPPSAGDLPDGAVGSGRVQAAATRLSQLPPGLVNVGNSCYVNSILQALACSERVVSFLERAADDVAADDARELAASSSASAAAPSLQAAAAAALQGLASTLCRAWLWVQGWEPSGNRSSTSTTATSRELRHRARCRLLLQLSPLLRALQPRYRPCALSEEEEPSSAAALSHAAPPPPAVDPSAALAALADEAGGALELGRQQDAAEALECLCECVDMELAAWHLMRGRWRLPEPLLHAGEAGGEPQGAQHAGASGTGADAHLDRSASAVPEAAACAAVGRSGSHECCGAEARMQQPHPAAPAEGAAPLLAGQPTQSGPCQPRSDTLIRPRLPRAPPPLPLRGLLARTSTCCVCGSSGPVTVEPWWSLRLPMPQAPLPRARTHAGHAHALGVRHSHSNSHSNSNTQTHGRASHSTQHHHRHPLLHHRHLLAAASLGAGATAQAAAISAALHLRDCLECAVQDELVDGVECARCSLRAAVRRLRALPARKPASPGGPGEAQGVVANGGMHDGAQAAPASCDAGGATDELEHAIDEAAALALAPHVPDMDVAEVLARLSRLHGAAAAAATAARGAAAAAARPARGAASSSGDTDPSDPVAAAACGVEAGASSSIDGDDTEPPAARGVLLAPVRCRALRSARVVRPPAVLALQLLRSTWDERTGAAVKDARHVAFPLQLGPHEWAALGWRGGAGGGSSAGGDPEEEPRERAASQPGPDDAPSAAAAPPPPPYVLVAVVVHMGGPTSGHYLVYRRVRLGVSVALGAGSMADNVGWLRVSDSAVAAAEEREVLAQNAAVLVYDAGTKV